MRSRSACLLACCTLCLASPTAFGGPDDRLRSTAPPPRAPLNLDLPTRDGILTEERVPALVVSPIFRAYTPTVAGPRTLRTENLEALANEQLARQAEQAAFAASVNSGACLARSGDSVGAGVRWSLNDGFGFYWQGKGLRDLQKLMGFNEINAICPPGDPNPMCRTMPKQVCN